VLVVDDNPINREFLQAALSEHARTVPVATDGHQAIAWCRDNSPDLVLMDLHMPGMDGLEAWEEICGDGDPPCPVIALTADCRPEERDRILAAGFDAFLNKPVALSSLLLTITEVCRLDPVEGLITGESRPAGYALHLPLLDQERALAACSDNPALVNKMQNMLAGELERDARKLDDFLFNGQIDQARELLHRWTGGCGYAGASRLEQQCAALEQALSLRPREPSEPGAGLAYHQLLVTISMTRHAIETPHTTEARTRRPGHNELPVG